MAGIDTAPSSPIVVVGFDVGSRRLGIAIGNSLSLDARGLCTLATRPIFPWDRVASLLDEWRPDLAVIGLPHAADGTPTRITPRALGLARELQRRFGLATVHIDERLSSHAAEQRHNASPAPGLDAHAAAVIIETWFREGASLNQRG